MSTVGRAFSRTITAGINGWAGDATPSGAAVEDNDGAGEGRAYQMTDYPNPGDTYAIQGNIGTSQGGGVTFDLALYRYTEKKTWELVQTLLTVADDADFRFNPIADGKVCVKITPSATITAAGTVTLVMELDQTDEFTVLRLMERRTSPAAVLNSVQMYSRDVGGVSLPYLRLSNGAEVPMATATGGLTLPATAAAAGSDSEILRFTGNVVGPAARNIDFLLEADAGDTNYRLLIKDNSSNTMLALAEALAYTPIDLCVGGTAMEATERLRVVNSVALVAAFESTDAGALGVKVDEYHNSANPAGSDVISEHSFYSRSSTAVKREMARHTITVTDPTNAAEDSTEEWMLMDAGSARQIMQLTGLGNLTLSGFDTGALGPVVSVFHDSANPAVSDVAARHSYFGRSSTAVQREYGRFDWVIVDPTNAAEDGSLSVSLMIAGALTEVLTRTGATPLIATDIADKAYVDGVINSGGWKDSGAFAELFTTADTVVAGAVAMEGAEKFRIVHTTPLVFALETTDAGAVGCTLSTHHRSAGPGDNDVVMRWSMFGEADAGAPTKTEMARFDCLVSDVSDTTEDAQLGLSVITGGALAEVLTLSGVNAIVTRTDNGAVGAELQLYQLSASPVQNDVVAAFTAYGQDATPAKVKVGSLEFLIDDPTAGAMDGAFRIRIAQGAAEQTIVEGKYDHASGALQMGFFGAAPVPKQSAATPNAAELKAALVALGFVNA